ncbi:unnamed protein product [Durusdinium trenchii]|uniref:Uncharacterized protein n=1 Tax=Durusdinium trenchii TaxID=1381693 RepID=A0ABP0PUG5_9DINO
MWKQWLLLSSLHGNSPIWACGWTSSSPPATPVKPCTTAELMEMEDPAAAAKFREVKAKIVQDMTDMAIHNVQLAETERRAHVVMVMHEKAQAQIGKSLCEAHMEKYCRVSFTTQSAPLDSKLEHIYRSVEVGQLRTVLYIDCTKLGVVSQIEINMIGDLAESVLFRNPSRSILVLIPPLLVGSDAAGSLRKDWRKLEDKLLAVKVELRPWTLNLNQDDLHKNRELPSAFVCFLGVPDSSLPTKGTAHRSVRGNPEVALASGTFPAALQEGDFIVPGDTLHCNDSRRNYTDFQETSQWLGGPAVPKAILSNLCGEMKSGDGVVVVHPTCYDGAVELAGLQLGFAVAGSSSVEAHHKCAQDVVKTHLLKAWKTSAAPHGSPNTSLQERCGAGRSSQEG